MIDFVKWLILIDVIGLFAFPITFTFFNKAIDKGYSVSKVLGLLLWGYIFWIGNSFSLLTNSRGGTFTALIILALISVIFLKKAKVETVAKWLKENKRQVIFHELVFLGAFLLWAIVRGANPDISGTEKPMELAFINAIYQSPAFPPSDPWLSGYSISYYYFGYMLVAGIMKLVGTVSGTAFNLAIALTFGLVACTSSGLLQNLLVRKDIHKKIPNSRKRMRHTMLLSLLAPLFILVISNGEGFLEVLHSRGVFWNITADNQFTSEFWSWLDIQDLSAEPPLPLDWTPNRLGGSWWWRASRVLQDYTVGGQSREIIDEFPFFSYLLADLHPHVLSMPYVLLAIFSGFYIFQNPLRKEAKADNIFRYLRMPALWFLAFTTGSLIFINTWDFPIYFGLISLAFIIPYIQNNGWSKESLREFLVFVIPFGIVSIIFYLPFLLGLSSQAGGLLPSLIYRTRLVHFFVMFFLPASVLSALLVYKLIKQKPDKRLIRIFITGLIIALFVFSLTLLIPLISNKVLQIINGLGNLAGIDTSAFLQNILIANQSFLGVYGAENTQALVVESLQRFLGYPLLVIFLLAGIAVVLYFLFTKKPKKENSIELDQQIDISDQYGFVLILLALLLTIFPEFFYLRDQFGWRMNTIFKFYFQAWILFALGSAYTVSNIRLVAGKKLKTIMAVGSIVIIIISLIYPAFSIFNKTNSFRNVEWSLDGNLFFEQYYPAEAEAISYLTELPYGVVAEAVGGSYSGYACVSRLSGYPTVLGWPGHELQWRGGGEEIGSRESDIQQLYEAYDWESAQAVLDQYQIRYVFIGSNERSQYNVREDKFLVHLPLVYDNNEVKIFAYPQTK